MNNPFETDNNNPFGAGNNNFGNMNSNNMNNGMGGMNNGMGNGMYGNYGGMNPNMNPNMGNGINNGFTGGTAPNITLWLVLGIIQIALLCCCNVLSFITGTITVIMVILANNAFKSGNIMEYQKMLSVAKISNISGWVLMVLGFILNIVLGVFDILASMF